MEPLSSTKITVTVVDDEGVPVGAVAIERLSRSKATANVLDRRLITHDQRRRGRRSPTSPRAVTARPCSASPRRQRPNGTIAHHVVSTSAPQPEEAPDAPPATWSKDLVAGNNLVVWNGDDDADPADGAAEGVVSIWSLTAAGWEGYFPTAADVPGGNNLDSLTNGEAYFVVVE